MSKHDEGMFYEQQFAPTMLSLRTETFTSENGKDKDVRVLTLADKNGQEMTVTGSRLIRKICYYLRKNTEFKGLQTCKPMMDKSDTELQKILQGALNVSDKENPMTFKFLLDHQDEIVSITSMKHSQISWAKLREIVEEPIKEKFGELDIVTFGTGRYSYKIPIKSKNVSSWIGLDVGNNLARGRSGIRIFTRFRTDKGGLGTSVPCMNWANLWQAPLTFFNVPVVRLDNVLSHDLVKSLNMQEIHVKNTAEGIEELKRHVAEELPKMVKAIKKFVPLFIDASKKVELTVKEMKDILIAYSVKVHLPDYVIDQIIEIANWQKEFSIWGFSNAVSWVRTHGEFRKGKNTIEDMQTVRNLERVAGEILSLTPTIEQLKQKIGTITLKSLIAPPKKEESEILQTQNGQLTIEVGA